MTLNIGMGDSFVYAPNEAAWQSDAQCNTAKARPP